MTNDSKATSSDTEHLSPDGDVTNYEGASKHTSIKVPTLYSLVARRQIPHIRVSGRLVLFRKSELDEWLRRRAVSVAAGNGAVAR